VGTAGLLVLTCLLHWSALQAADPVKLRKAVIPVFTKASQPVLAAVITIEQAAAEPRRIGFFKIPAYPKFVLENVRVTVRNPDGVADFLREFSMRLNSLAGTLPWEIRHLEILAGTPESCRLDARRAYLDRESELATLILEHTYCGSQPDATARARLTVRDNPAGLLVSALKDQQTVEYDLLTDKFSIIPLHSTPNL
jgi:hypothetical protein